MIIQCKDAKFTEDEPFPFCTLDTLSSNISLMTKCYLCTQDKLIYETDYHERVSREGDTLLWFHNLTLSAANLWPKFLFITTTKGVFRQSAYSFLYSHTFDHWTGLYLPQTANVVTVASASEECREYQHSVCLCDFSVSNRYHNAPGTPVLSIIFIQPLVLFLSC